MYPIPESIRCWPKPSTQRYEDTVEDCMIFSEVLLRKSGELDTEIYNRCVRFVLDGANVPGLSESLLRQSWLPNWEGTLIYRKDPISLLQELDRAELFYSAVTRQNKEHFAAPSGRLLELAHQIANAHACLQENFYKFSGKKTVDWAMVEYGKMKEGLRDSDPILELSLEKFYSILVGGGVFYNFRNVVIADNV